MELMELDVPGMVDQLRQGMMRVGNPRLIPHQWKGNFDESPIPLRGRPDDKN